jgi:hypothetical protein
MIDPGLPPMKEDKNVGKVAIDPGFQIREYRILIVSDFSIEGLKPNKALPPQEASAYLKAELVQKISSIGVFDVVTEAKEPIAKSKEKALLIEGAITALDPGSSGDGHTKVAIVTRFKDAKTGKVYVVTADGRGAASDVFGGDSVRRLMTSIDELADGIAEFIKRLSR